ncbi:MAG: cysteine desulfurase [Lachnospiraceae bacterium]|nr:cysteine desulfurase [Lachnospiraceae bacterium]
MEVYLDNSATTRTFDQVAELMVQIMTEDYGNPSSMHTKGVEAERYLRYATDTLAKMLKVSTKEIFFTSGGTESDNWALMGAAYANRRAGMHIITTQIEHPAILQMMQILSKEGFEVTYLPVDSYGVVSLDALREAIRPDTILVSMMHVNNEVGALEPIEEAGRLIKSINRNTLFHVDAVQSFGKFCIYPKKYNIDMLSVSGHKIHGPKGVGFLYVGEAVKLSPILWGGGQQKGMRPGTENVPAIAGMAKAAETLYRDLEKEREKLYRLREEFIDGALGIDRVVLNGPRGREGAPHIVSLSVAGIRSEVLLHALEERGICVSAGSACASRKHSISATLKAMGVSQDLLDSTIRFSFSIFTTKEEIDYTLQVLREIIPLLRKYTRR